MTEPHEYAELLGVRVGSAIPAGSPGRALVSHPDYGALEMQVALPVLEGDSATDAHDDERSANLDDDLAIELRERVATLAAAWPATVAAQGGPPAVELLPERVGLASLLGGPAPSTSSLAAPIGRESLALATAWLRLGSETPHALVVGPRRSGKTTALLCAASALAAQHGAEELRLYILDGPRGGLASLRQLPNLALYANDEAGAANMHEALLAARAAGGTRRLILVDDYSLCRERMRAQLTQSYGSPSLFDTLCEIAQLGGQHGEHLLLATGTTFADDNLLRAMDAGRAGLLLWPGRYEGGVRLLGVPLPLADQRGADQPAGRALLVCEDEQQLVQIALP
jgi:S-DNA-T family DNA segregation ATPase FtsK/SpoIIIE